MSDSLAFLTHQSRQKQRAQDTQPRTRRASVSSTSLFAIGNDIREAGFDYFERIPRSSKVQLDLNAGINEGASTSAGVTFDEVKNNDAKNTNENIEYEDIEYLDLAVESIQSEDETGDYEIAQLFEIQPDAVDDNDVLWNYGDDSNDEPLHDKQSNRGDFDDESDDLGLMNLFGEVSLADDEGDEFIYFDVFGTDDLNEEQIETTVDNVIATIATAPANDSSEGDDVKNDIAQSPIESIDGAITFDGENQADSVKSGIFQNLLSFSLINNQYGSTICLLQLMTSLKRQQLNQYVTYCLDDNCSMILNHFNGYQARHSVCQDALVQCPWTVNRFSIV